MLEFLVNKSKVGSRDSKYRVMKKRDESYFNKSRSNKDIEGNNVSHFVFQIEDTTLRYKILNILLLEEIGDLTKRNKLGYLPSEIEHGLEYNLIPKECQPHFKEAF